MYHIHNQVSAIILQPHMARKRQQSHLSFIIDRSWSMSSEFTDYSKMQKKTRFQWVKDALVDFDGLADFYFFDEKLEGPFTTASESQLRFQCTDLVESMLEFSKIAEKGSHLIVITDGCDPRFQRMMFSETSHDSKGIQDRAVLNQSLRDLESIMFLGVGDAESIANQPAESIHRNGLSVRVLPHGLKDAIRRLYNRVRSVVRTVNIDVEMLNGRKKTISMQQSLVEPTVFIAENIKSSTEPVPDSLKSLVMGALIQNYMYKEFPVEQLDEAAQLVVQWYPSPCETSNRLLTQIAVAIVGSTGSKRSVAWGCCRSLEFSALANLCHLRIPGHAFDSIVSQFVKNPSKFSDIVYEVIAELTPDIEESLEY